MVKEIFNMSNKVYDTAKWIVQVGFPAAITLYATTSAIWGWSMTEQVVASAGAIVTFGGVVLGISSVKYVNEHAPHLNEENPSPPYGHIPES